MNIAMAHDSKSKNRRTVLYCVQWADPLSHHNLCAYRTTCNGRLRPLAWRSSGSSAAPMVQHIRSRIACNEIDLLLFFRDPITPRPAEKNGADLLRLCDVHNIPVATNIATAEALIHALERGDLDWRDIVNPSR